MRPIWPQFAMQLQVLTGGHEPHVWERMVGGGDGVPEYCVARR